MNKTKPKSNQSSFSLREKARMRVWMRVVDEDADEGIDENMDKTTIQMTLTENSVITSQFSGDT